ncbi:hypothetical protein CVT24_004824 [Panaeolus cyanescens]|uniref:Uncharacterized protein n=1 Tax=Panaeolus cyanescens TaxID=181874 RepID=A0A409W209_9AGAR|nr:hypothetical protein CVT24_004824 [Panaeolus cyanescens]
MSMSIRSGTGGGAGSIAQVLGDVWGAGASSQHGGGGGGPQGATNPNISLDHTINTHANTGSNPRLSTAAAENSRTPKPIQVVPMPASVGMNATANSSTSSAATYGVQIPSVHGSGQGQGERERRRERDGHRHSTASASASRREKEKEKETSSRRERDKEGRRYSHQPTSAGSLGSVLSYVSSRHGGHGHGYYKSGAGGGGIETIKEVDGYSESERRGGGDRLPPPFSDSADTSPVDGGNFAGVGAGGGKRGSGYRSSMGVGGAAGASQSTIRGGGGRERDKGKDTHRDSRHRVREHEREYSSPNAHASSSATAAAPAPVAVAGSSTAASMNMPPPVYMATPGPSAPIPGLTTAPVTSAAPAFTPVATAVPLDRDINTSIGSNFSLNLSISPASLRPPPAYKAERERQLANVPHEALVAQLVQKEHESAEVGRLLEKAVRGVERLRAKRREGEERAREGEERVKREVEERVRRELEEGLRGAEERAQEAEERVGEMRVRIERLESENRGLAVRSREAVLEAQRESAKSGEDVAQWKLKAEWAENEIARGRSVVVHLETQIADLERELEKARSAARQFKEQTVILYAREEAHRQGFEEGLKQGRQAGQEQLALLGVDDSSTADNKKGKKKSQGSVIQAERTRSAPAGPSQLEMENHLAQLNKIHDNEMLRIRKQLSNAERERDRERSGKREAEARIGDMEKSLREMKQREEARRREEEDERERRRKEEEEEREKMRKEVSRLKEEMRRERVDREIREREKEAREREKERERDEAEREREREKEREKAEREREREREMAERERELDERERDLEREQQMMTPSRPIPYLSMPMAPPPTAVQPVGMPVASIPVLPVVPVATTSSVTSHMGMGGGMPQPEIPNIVPRGGPGVGVGMPEVEIPNIVLKGGQVYTPGGGIQSGGMPEPSIPNIVPRGYTPGGVGMPEVEIPNIVPKGGGVGMPEVEIPNIVPPRSHTPYTPHSSHGAGAGGGMPEPSIPHIVPRSHTPYTPGGTGMPEPNIPNIIPRSHSPHTPGGSGMPEPTIPHIVLRSHTPGGGVGMPEVSIPHIIPRGGGQTPAGGFGMPEVNIPHILPRSHTPRTPGGKGMPEPTIPHIVPRSHTPGGGGGGMPEPTIPHIVPRGGQTTSERGHRRRDSTGSSVASTMPLEFIPGPGAGGWGGMGTIPEDISVRGPSPGPVPVPAPGGLGMPVASVPSFGVPGSDRGGAGGGMPTPTIPQFPGGATPVPPPGSRGTGMTPYTSGSNPLPNPPEWLHNPPADYTKVPYTGPKEGILSHEQLYGGAMNRPSSRASRANEHLDVVQPRPLDLRRAGSNGSWHIQVIGPSRPPSGHGNPEETRNSFLSPNHQPAPLPHPDTTSSRRSGHSRSGSGAGAAPASPSMGWGQALPTRPRSRAGGGPSRSGSPVTAPDGTYGNPLRTNHGAGASPSGGAIYGNPIRGTPSLPTNPLPSVIRATTPGGFGGGNVPTAPNSPEAQPTIIPASTTIGRKKKGKLAAARTSVYGNPTKTNDGDEDDGEPIFIPPGPVPSFAASAGRAGSSGSATPGKKTGMIMVPSKGSNAPITSISASPIVAPVGFPSPNMGGNQPLGFGGWGGAGTAGSAGGGGSVFGFGGGGFGAGTAGSASGRSPFGRTAELAQQRDDDEGSENTIDRMTRQNTLRNQISTTGFGFGASAGGGGGGGSVAASPNLNANRRSVFGMPSPTIPNIVPGTAGSSGGGGGGGLFGGVSVFGDSGAGISMPEATVPQIVEEPVAMPEPSVPNIVPDPPTTTAGKKKKKKK